MVKCDLDLKLLSVHDTNSYHLLASKQYKNIESNLAKAQIVKKITPLKTLLNALLIS